MDAGPHTATASIVSGPGSFVGSPTCTYTGGGGDGELHGDDHVGCDRDDGGVGDVGDPGQRRDDHADDGHGGEHDRRRSAERVEGVGGREHPDHAGDGDERGRRRTMC